jgi:hypothetical protein
VHGVVTLTSAAPAGGFAVRLAVDPQNAATLQSAVTTQPGHTTAMFTITPDEPARGKNITVTATAGSTTKTATLTVAA